MSLTCTRLQLSFSTFLDDTLFSKHKDLTPSFVFKHISSYSSAHGLENSVNPINVRASFSKKHYIPPLPNLIFWPTCLSLYEYTWASSRPKLRYSYLLMLLPIVVPNFLDLVARWSTPHQTQASVYKAIIRSSACMVLIWDHITN
ncbi:hypothetical protein AVEN_267158-1 [Araneus ventricosus]|uniref:Uncharacterized protein n=1 Tax=Araneus ventricosus TaxID=182803 RepID=A0A4Y2LJJ4_ARAVE|nr:hypothetical protein AVEN_267158-1 [Araneus ventricosus]